MPAPVGDHAVVNSTRCSVPITPNHALVHAYTMCGRSVFRKCEANGWKTPSRSLSERISHLSKWIDGDREIPAKIRKITNGGSISDGKELQSDQGLRASTHDERRQNRGGCCRR